MRDGPQWSWRRRGAGSAAKNWRRSDQAWCSTFAVGRPLAKVAADRDISDQAIASSAIADYIRERQQMNDELRGIAEVSDLPRDI
ncbi:hypothetical protein [Streptomyces yerevanensis]|uniref:hypothetical protein n=1 Tax=Streptomyces yerevanensis TaxID=66378 RepID=UPI0005278EDA|nr:hypothetical protein [Streptomyces yerevanensis]